MVADAHSLPFKEDCFDLVACTGAWHWLNPKAVCPEVSRIIKKSGCLAVYSYAPVILSHLECDKHLQQVFNMLEASYHPKAKLCRNRYRNVELSFPVSVRHDMTVPMNFKVSELVGFIQTLSAYRAFCEKYLDNNLLNDFEKALKKAVSEDVTIGKDVVEDPTLEALIPMFLLLCIKDV